MENINTEFILFAVGIIIAVGEIVKMYKVPAKILPIVNILVGGVFAYLYSGVDVKTAVLMGLIAGLTASGVYSGSKNIAEGIGLGK